MSDPQRLHKYMAHAGVASRRACERLIAQGLVKVNGKVVREQGVTVEPGVDVVEYDGRRIELDPRSVYLLLYKPTQCISSVEDPEGRQTVIDLVPRDFGRLYPVGRLDWDSEGAILLTNDGELTELLTHPKHEVPKTYQVKVSGVWADHDPRIEKLRGGVRLRDGFRTGPAEIFYDNDTGRHTWFVVTIHEGHNRQIRQMFESVGIDVRRLRRLSIGPLLLGDLEPTQWRRLEESEIDALYEAAGGKREATDASRGRLSHDKRDAKAELRRQARRDADVGGHQRARTSRASASSASDDQRPSRSDVGGGRTGGRKSSGGGRNSRGPNRSQRGGRSRRGPKKR